MLNRYEVVGRGSRVPPTLEPKEGPSMSIYRKIYEQNHGFIPVDEDGRTYEIHHIDGNRKNNDISNLIAVTIQEHYDIHFNQKNYAACIRIACRMSMTVEEISKKASEINVQRAKEGKHPSQTEKFKNKLSIIKKEEYLSGIHPFCDHKNLSEWAKKGSLDRIQAGTHHFCDPEYHRKHARERVLNGTHNFQNPEKVTCPHCGKIGNKGPMTNHINKFCNNIPASIEE